MTGICCTNLPIVSSGRRGRCSPWGFLKSRLGLNSGVGAGTGVQPQEKSLAQRYPDFSDGLILLGGFDPFGDGLTSLAEGDFKQGVNELLFAVIAVDSLDEMPVQFDIFEAQLRPEAQSGKPAPRSSIAMLKPICR